jgi:hypothetical protein
VSALTLCRTDFRLGSFSDLGARSCEVRFTSMSGHRQAEPACPKSAMTGSGRPLFGHIDGPGKQYRRKFVQFEPGPSRFAYD